MNAIRLVLTHASLYAGYFSTRGIRVRKMGYRITPHLPDWDNALYWVKTPDIKKGKVAG
jgi:hypothetical protein